MKYIRLLPALGIIGFLSCNNGANNSASNNDTTQAVELAIRTAMEGNRPDFDSIRAQYHSGDTILFTTDSLPLGDLPKKVDSLHLKVVSPEQICAGTDSNGHHPDYLYIRAFAKLDTGYYVSLQSQNCEIASNGDALGVYIAKRKTKGR